MTKKQLIKSILEEANIHHNIRINFSKMPDYTEEDSKNGFDWQIIADDSVSIFKDNFEDWEENKHNDTGNRNIGDKCETKGEIWTSGRTGATLIWDAYWKLTNNGYHFRYDEADLEEETIDKLKEILGDIVYFKKAVKGLMLGFYEACKNHLEEVREEKKQEDKAEAQYQRTLKTVKDNGMIKRLVSDLL